MTDIDRLHRVALGELTGRRCGKTVAACHNVCGALEVGERDLMFVVSQRQDVRHIMPQLIAALAEHGICVTRQAHDHLEGMLDGEDWRIRWAVVGNREARHGVAAQVDMTRYGTLEDDDREAAWKCRDNPFLTSPPK